ncbi:hypothetical protein ACCT28_23045 [Rhizobium ruizarguesonis]
MGCDLLHQSVYVGYAVFGVVELNIWIIVETVQQFNQLLSKIFKPFAHALLHKKAEQNRPVKIGFMASVSYCGGMRAVW